MSGYKFSTLRAVFLALIIVGGPVVLATDALAAKAQYYTGLVRGVAVGGYDPVAYFTVGKPVRGKKKFETEWDGVKWRFSSAENRDTFLKMPASFAPQFGGYCAYAVGIGKTAKGSPRNWKIVDGKLYLNYNRSIQRTWVRKQSYYIRKGRKNWPRVLR